jgi:hypothetical protein
MVVFGILVQSCFHQECYSPEVAKQQEDSITQFEGYTKQGITKGIEEFKSDVRLKSLITEFSFITAQNPNDDTFDSNAVFGSMQRMQEITKQLNQEYGLENIKQYCKVLEIANVSNMRGNCCSLGPKGNVNWSCCGFWATISATLESEFTCKPLDSMTASASDWKAYYTCLQGVICSTC